MVVVAEEQVYVDFELTFKFCLFVFFVFFFFILDSFQSLVCCCQIWRSVCKVSGRRGVGRLLVGG